MKISKKSFMSACAAFAAALLIPSMNVYAADSYTVTFRPGNVGYFATEANEEGDRQEMAEIVAAQEYSGYSYEVTKNGAIKVFVSAGSTAPNAPTYIQSESGYFVKGTSSWGPNGETVDRNTDYVVDYGKLVDGVEYTVECVDVDSLESIAPVYITQANIGESRSVTAPSQIVVSGSTVYNLVSEGTLELVLDADASKNVFTFSYKMAPSGTTVEEVTVDGEGTIVTTTEYATTTVNGGQPANAAAAGGAAGGAAAGAADDGQADNVVEIADEETPLAGNADNDNTEETGGVVEIGDEEVPLAAGEEPLANMAVIGAAIFAVGAVLIAGMWLFMKKKRVIEQNNEE